ncbi:MAG: hypothetical protein AB1486_10085 [Planctomycetota bacterium]
MNIHQLGGPSGGAPSRNERVTRSRARGSGASPSTQSGEAPRDAVAVDRETLDRVRLLRTQILDSPEVRRERVEQLRKEYLEGRLRQRAIFEATSEAILKGQSILDDIDLDELM